VIFINVTDALTEKNYIKHKKHKTH